MGGRVNTARGDRALDRWLARAVLWAAGLVAATAIAVAGLWLWRPTPAAGGSAQSAAGYTLAYIGSVSGEGVDLYLADAAGERVTRLTETIADESWPAWSPDGRHVGMIARPPAGEGRLQPAVLLTVCEAATGALEAQEVGVEEEPTGLECPPAWTPDGRAVVFSGPSLAESRDGVLAPLRLELATGALTQLTFGGQFAAVSARGMVACLGVPPAGSQIWTVNAAGGARQRVGERLGPEVWCWGLAWSPDGRRLASIEGGGDASFLVIRTPEEGIVAEYATPLEGRHTVLYPAWSADGRYVAYMALTDLEGPLPDGTLVVADTEADAIAAWPAAPGALRAFPSWRPAEQIEE